MSGELAWPELYLVVVNHEEQYSIWRATRPVPAGWRRVGFEGTRDACLDHIESIWIDMRPLSVRRFLAQDGGPEINP